MSAWTWVDIVFTVLMVGGAIYHFTVGFILQREMTQMRRLNKEGEESLRNIYHLYFIEHGTKVQRCKCEFCNHHRKNIGLQELT